MHKIAAPTMEAVMHVFLMLIAFLGHDGMTVLAKPYASVAACEAAKPAVTASALANGIADLGLTCTDVVVGKVA